MCAGDPLGVPARPADQHRGEAALEEQPDEVEAGQVRRRCRRRRAGQPSSPVTSGSNQAELLPEAGAPDDVGDVEHRAVVEHRPTVVDADRARLGEVAPRRVEVARADPQQGSAAGPDLRLHPAARSACAPSARGWPGTTAPAGRCRIRRDPNGTGTSGIARPDSQVSCPPARSPGRCRRRTGRRRPPAPARAAAGRGCGSRTSAAAGSRGRARRRTSGTSGMVLGAAGDDDVVGERCRRRTS